MARKIIKTEKLICDYCGKEIKEEVSGVHEGMRMRIMQMSYDVWYGGLFKAVEICEECNKKIVTFFYENNLFHGAKQ